MRRISTWILSTLSITVLLFGYHTSTSGSATTAAETVISSSTSGSSTTTASGSGGNGNRNGSASGTGRSSNATSATTVTGSVVNTRYGPVQVAITTNGSAITDVSVLQYPHSNGQDAQINGYALPVLIQSTMAAQNANVDMVSGATFTSMGYRQSLQSALDQVGL
ncbi:MAG: FMN-binding protein [Nocardioides sp.]